MNRYTDSWESRPEFPPALITEEPIAPEHARSGKRRLAPVLAAIAAAGLAGGIYEAHGALVKGHQKPSPSEIKRRQEDARIFFVLKAMTRAAAGRYGYCGRQEVLAPRKYHRRDILEYNNLLRGDLGEPPLIEDKLLDYSAQHAAQQLADQPASIDSFEIAPAQKNRLRLEGASTGKWTRIYVELAQSGDGQAARAASCLIDSRSGAQTIKESTYIGIGSARLSDSQRFLAIEYGAKPG